MDMLNLTRKPHEVILIGDDIRVVVVSVIGGHVRLGIDAPKSVSVDRKEVRDRKEREAKELDGNTAPAGRGL